MFFHLSETGFIPHMRSTFPIDFLLYFYFLFQLHMSHDVKTCMSQLPNSGSQG